MVGFRARALCPRVSFSCPCASSSTARTRRSGDFFNAVTPLVEPLYQRRGLPRKCHRHRPLMPPSREGHSAGASSRSRGSPPRDRASPNKMLAKIAEATGASRTASCRHFGPHRRIHARRKTARACQDLGSRAQERGRFNAASIQACRDLQRFSLAEMMLRHGKWGEELSPQLPGRRTIGPCDRMRIRKSISNERTYFENITSLSACATAMEELIDELREGLSSAARPPSAASTRCS